MSAQQIEERTIGAIISFGNHMIEIADRLMIVNAKNQTLQPGFLFGNRTQVGEPG